MEVRVLVEKFMVVLPLSQSVILITCDVVLLPGYPPPIGVAHLLKLLPSTLYIGHCRAHPLKVNT